jgi:transposase
MADNNILFLDETGFNLHTSNNYGYSPVNTDAYRTVPRSRGRNVSLLAMASNSQIISIKTRLGAYNRDSYLEFLRESVNNNVLKSGMVLICDNVAFHRCQEIVDFLHCHGIIYTFLPSYSPKLNPIEEVFSVIKSRYAMIRPVASTTTDIIANINNVIEAMNSEITFNFQGFYSHMRTFLDKAFNFEDF